VTVSGTPKLRGEKKMVAERHNPVEFVARCKKIVFKEKAYL